MKIQTASQRIGEAGEDSFRRCARRLGMIANRAERDYGIDFFCMVTNPRDRLRKVGITGDVLGAFVRATVGRRARIRLSRADASHLLECRFPVCVVMVHHPEQSDETFHFRFVDDTFAARLADFLHSTDKSLTLASADLLPESAFPMHLQQVTQPGFMERLTVTLASSLVQRILPKTRLEIRRSTDGELTLVVLERFGDHFEVTDDSAKILFHDAMFGLRERMLERFSQIPVKESISIPLSNLPTPIAFVGPIETSEIALRVTSGERETLCNCEVRRTNDYRGFVHPSGFAITISRAMQRDGVFVHYINVEIDNASTSQLPAFPDLWNFLAQCEPDGILHIGDLKLPVTGVGALAACGFFARYLQTVYPLHSWPDGTWLLRDALQEETLNTLGWLAGLRHLDDQFAGAGLANERLSEFAEESKSFQVPVCANLPRCGVVTWLKTHGTLLVNAERAIAGVRFGRVRGFNIQTQSDRFAKSVYPAIAIHRDWPLIELTPEGFRETSENDLGYDLEID